MSNQVAKNGGRIMVNRLDLKTLLYFYIKIRACRHVLFTVPLKMKPSVNTCPYTNLYNLSILK